MKKKSKHSPLWNNDDLNNYIQDHNELLLTTGLEHGDGRTCCNCVICECVICKSQKHQLFIPQANNKIYS